MSEVERILATRRLAAARDDGRITQDQARLRIPRAATARTRPELAAALHGVPDTVVPPPLLLLSRVAIAGWVVATVVQLVVWMAISVISGDWGEAWWIWTPVGGAPVAAALWWTFEWNHDRAGESDAVELRDGGLE